MCCARGDTSEYESSFFFRIVFLLLDFDKKTTGDTTYPSASGGLRDAYDQVTHPEERGHPCGEAVHDDDRGWMVKSGEIGGFVGGSLKEWLGAQ